MMTPSDTSDSHFSDDSSDVESYHQSKLKQMTHVPLGYNPGQVAPQQNTFAYQP